MNKILFQIWPSLVTAFCVSAFFSILLALVVDIIGKAAPTRTGGKMPLTGGVGIFFGFFVGLLVFGINNFHKLDGFFFLMGVVFLFGASFPYFLLGILDDIFHFRPVPKLIGFAIVAAVQIIALFYLFSGSDIWPFFLCLFIIGVLFFFSNSYNFLDNADGHCASAVRGLAFALFFMSKEPGLWSYAGLVLASAVLGFLVWNFPVKPVLYLGDAGSLFLGSCAPALALSAIFDITKDSCDFSVGMCFVVTLLAFPLYDTCAVMFLRIWRGQNPTIGGQDHYSHRLMRGGFPLWAVNLWTFIASGVFPAVILRLPERYYPIGPFAIIFALFCVDYFAYFSADRSKKTDSAD